MNSLLLVYGASGDPRYSTRNWPFLLIQQLLLFVDFMRTQLVQLGLVALTIRR